jgi:hypothetical protein
VTVPGAFTPLVDEELFRKAQTVLSEQKKPYTKEGLLKGLRRILQQKGRLSFSILKETPDIPSIDTIIRHFGSLRTAFDLAGYKRRSPMPSQEQLSRANMARGELINKILFLFPLEVVVHPDTAGEPGFLVIDGLFRVSVVVCPAVRRNNRVEWFLDRVRAKPAAITLLTRMTPENTHSYDFYLLRTPGRNWIRPGELNKHARLSALSNFCREARALAFFASEHATGDADEFYPRG